MRDGMTYNCARVHVGGYVGGGTNEDEQWIDCNYEVTAGTITTRKLRPIRVRGMNTEGTIFTLSTFVLYPTSEMASVTINKGMRKFHVRLVKSRKAQNTMFKLTL